MTLLDLTLPSPAQNLALDEALLLDCDAGRGPQVLRFWESPVPFVVLGYSGQAAQECRLDACRKDGVPVLRRVTGGGSVLQGPDCLNYALVLKAGNDPNLSATPKANAWIMERQRRALLPLSPEIRVEGTTDLALNNRKFSGNAQRRLKRALLFHGTFLFDFDIEAVGKYLRLPDRQPAYRRGRDHVDFLTRAPGTPAEAKAMLAKEWEAEAARTGFSRPAALGKLLAEKYGNSAWNMKF